MYPYPYGYSKHRIVEKPFSDMTYEFDPLYIKALVAQHLIEQRSAKRQIWLNKVKSLFINFGRRIQSVLHNSSAADKVSLKSAPVHIHSHRHHK